MEQTQEASGNFFPVHFSEAKESLKLVDCSLDKEQQILLNK